MLMSQAAMSAVPTGLPRLGASAEAAPAASNSANQTPGVAQLRVRMLDLPGAVDRPASDGIAVLVQNRRHGGDHLQFAALGDELGSGRLCIAGLVPSQALQNRGTA